MNRCFGLVVSDQRFGDYLFAALDALVAPFGNTWRFRFPPRSRRSRPSSGMGLVNRSHHLERKQQMPCVAARIKNCSRAYCTVSGMVTVFERGFVPPVVAGTTADKLPVGVQGLLGVLGVPGLLGVLGVPGLLGVLGVPELLPPPQLAIQSMEHARIATKVS